MLALATIEWLESHRTHLGEFLVRRSNDPAYDPASAASLWPLHTGRVPWLVNVRGVQHTSTSSNPKRAWPMVSVKAAWNESAAPHLKSLRLHLKLFSSATAISRLRWWGP